MSDSRYDIVLNGNVVHAVVALEELPELYRRALTRGVRRALKETLSLAQEMSSGSMTDKDYRLLDHPFARRHGVALSNPAIINIHSGEFLEAWSISLPDMSSSEIAGRVWNDAPVTEFLEGTTKMLPRPIGTELERFLKERLNETLKEEVEEYMEANS